MRIRPPRWPARSSRRTFPSISVRKAIEEAVDETCEAHAAKPQSNSVCETMREKQFEDQAAEVARKELTSHVPPSPVRKAMEEADEESREAHMANLPSDPDCNAMGEKQFKDQAARFDAMDCTYSESLGVIPHDADKF